MAATTAPDGIEAESWETLCDRVREGECVPVVGAAARHPPLLSPAQLADEIASEHAYPLLDTHDLASVSQFMRLKRKDTHAAHELVARKIKKQLEGLDDWGDADHPLRVLANLPLPVYVTTGYDDLLTRALVADATQPTPRSVVCSWLPTDRPESRADAYRDLDGLEEFQPTATEPIVFHLHGLYLQPGTMVLTEADHLALNAQLADDGINQSILPTPVKDSLASSALMFLGFRHTDRNFRSLLYSLSRATPNSKPAIAVQIDASEVAAEEQLEEARRFLEQYLGALRGGEGRVSIHWGSMREFMTKLRDCVKKT